MAFEEDLCLYRDEGIRYIEVCEGKLDAAHPEIQLERLKETGLDLLRAIRSTSYAGVYTLEIFSETSLPNLLWNDPRKTVRDGKKAFANLWKEVCA